MKKVFFLLLALLSLTQGMQAQTVEDGEAFYVYRNDGEFNGFFFDEIVDMRFSRVDYEGVEHDEFVVQEIETADSIYRIPLAAIDSIGFQQPELKMNTKFYALGTDGCPYYSEKYGGFYMDFEGEDDYTLHWYMKGEENANGKWVYPAQYVPKVDDVLYYPYWMGNNSEHTGVFVGKVKEVRDDAEYTDYDGNICAKYIICEPIEDIGEVFEQFVTVEEIGYDETGQARSRMAGLNTLPEKMRNLAKARRVSGNKELTLVSLNTRLTLPWKNADDNFEASLGANVEFVMKGRVMYNITRREFQVKFVFNEDLNVSVDLTAKGTIEDKKLLPIVGVPIYIPSMLPLFQVDPCPGAFIAASGDLSLSIKSPTMGWHGAQSIMINGTDITGNFRDRDEENKDNSWGMELSLNGSLHSGMYQETKLGTASWASRFLHADIGLENYCGPKLSASFKLDPVAAANGDLYSSIGSSVISFSPFCTAIEANATVKAGKNERKFKFMEMEKNFLKTDITLFPQFKNTEVGTPEVKKEGNLFGVLSDHIPNLSKQISFATGKTNVVQTTIHPIGLSVPFYIGAAAYTTDKELVSKVYKDIDQNRNMYSLFNTYDKMTFDVPLFDGDYLIVPVVDAFGYDAPAWDAAKTVKSDLALDHRWLKKGEDGIVREWSWNWNSIAPGDEVILVVFNVMHEDEVSFELIPEKSNWYGPTPSGQENERISSLYTIQQRFGADILAELGCQKTHVLFYRFKAESIPSKRTTSEGHKTGSVNVWFNIVAERQGRVRKQEAQYTISNDKLYE